MFGTDPRPTRNCPTKERRYHSSRPAAARHGVPVRERGEASARFLSLSPVTAVACFCYWFSGAVRVAPGGTRLPVTL